MIRTSYIIFVLGVLLVSCSEYKGLMKDGKSFEDAHMYEKALANYNRAYALRSNPESLIARKRITEQILQNKFANPIRLASAQGDLYTAKNLFAQLATFVEANKELEISMPPDLNTMIEASKEAWYKVKFDLATTLTQDASYDEALEVIKEIRFMVGNAKELDYLENLCKVMPAYYEGEKAYNESRWREAYDAYGRVVKLDPSFRDAKEKLDLSLEKGRVRVAYVAVDTKSISNEVEREIGAYINQELLEDKDPFLQILDRDYTQKIMEEQQMVMSGLYDENSVIQAGRLTGAKYILLGEVIEYKESHVQENYGIRKGFLGKSIDDKRIKYQMWNDQYRVVARTRVSMLDAESGETLFTLILPGDSTIKVQWAEYKGDISQVYPGNWKWELINSREDYVDANGYQELQKSFASKPNTSELNKIREVIFSYMAGEVKRKVTRTFQ